MITFSGTSYLALDRHPQMIEWIIKGMNLYGTHFGGSRRSKLAPDIYEKAEEQLSKWTGAPSALLVSSGTTAGQLVNLYLAQKEMKYCYSPSVHPALKGKTGKQSNTWKDWFDQLKLGNTVGLTDSINPLKVSQPDWMGLPQIEDSLLVVDDAHYLGIGGHYGSGSWQELSQEWKGELIVVASLGKALTTPAGLILAKKEVIEELKQLSQFGGASPPSPAFVFALTQAQDLIRQQQIKLQKNIHAIQRFLGQTERFTFLPNYPVVGVSDHRLAQRLYEKEMLISSFHYPNPSAPLYTRIVLRADHTEEQLQKLMHGILSK